MEIVLSRLLAFFLAGIGDHRAYRGRSVEVVFVRGGLSCRCYR